MNQELKEEVLEALLKICRFWSIGGARLMCALGLMWASQAGAIEPETDQRYHISIHFKDVADKVAVAEVVVIYPTVFFLAQLTEEELNNYGCRYLINDKQEQSKLMAILQQGDIGVPEQYDRKDIDPRYAVYLRLKNGKREKLLFEGTGPGDESSLGKFMDAEIVRAYNPRFASQFRAWAATLLPVTPLGSSCRPPNTSTRK